MLSATYSPEDNKLRLYADSRLDGDLYQRVRDAGFSWAPKQELFVAPAWTPEREDLLLELCGDIDDEDTSLVERAEQRADRFEDYSDARQAEAERARAAVDELADGIPLGQPILVGHHSEKRARKHAERIKSGMTKAVKLWQTHKYWLDRAQGALHHAKYKELPAVRARRIKKLEADQRRTQRSQQEADACLKAWRACKTIEHGRLIAGRTLAGHLACCPHATVKGSHWSAYDVLQPDESRYQECPAWTLEQVQAKAAEVYPGRSAYYQRWIDHYGNRIAYEKAMLNEQGGTKADQVKPEVGGAVQCWASPPRGWSIIQKVNKVSVTLLDSWGNGQKPFNRTIPFDKLSAIMTRGQVEIALSNGAVKNEIGGLFLKNAPPPGACSADEPWTPPAADARDEQFEAMQDSLKAGVSVVAAPQLFETPPDLAQRVVDLADVQDGHRVLEPSAGTGRLVDPLLNADATAWKMGDKGSLVMVEVNFELAKRLTARYAAATVICADFFNFAAAVEKFDRIIMNPPFKDAADVKHVRHALTLLKPGGRLVAIVAGGPRQREAFAEMGATWDDLPADSFKSAGTSVHTAIVVIDR